MFHRGALWLAEADNWILFFLKFAFVLLLWWWYFWCLRQVVRVYGLCPRICRSFALLCWRANVCKLFTQALNLQVSNLKLTLQLHYLCIHINSTNLDKFVWWWTVFVTWFFRVIIWIWIISLPWLYGPCFRTFRLCRSCVLVYRFILLRTLASYNLMWHLLLVPPCQLLQS